MFGCLGRFIKTIILILAVIGFFAIGGVTFFKDLIKNPLAQHKANTIEKAADIADFSSLDEEFKVVSSNKLPKIGKYVYIKHDATSQKFYFSKPSKQDILTKQDFSSKEADLKIIKFIDDVKILQLENFEITGKGTMSALGQQIPFVKFKSDIVNVPIHGLQGIIGVFEQDNQNIIIVAVNSSGKYSQIITDVLLKQMR